MKKNPLSLLTERGQSVWLDNLTRPLLQSGQLARLIREDGLSGVTSNPAIFKNAMTSGDAYDRQIRELARSGESGVGVYEALAIEDIRGAADVLRPVYDRTEGVDGFVSLEVSPQTEGVDGFVSLEVSPHLARDTRGTIDEAARLWAAVERPNVLIKIPGTDEGVPAIEACLDRGININITLLFSLAAHKKVLEAYFRAMESRQRRGEPLRGVASVASFFLSRIDTKVDKALDGMIAEGRNLEEAKALRGRAAIANARLAYRIWKEIHASDRWGKLAKSGAPLQRPLWASTSTKDPKESDVKYIEALIGPQTVNTIPDETIDAFRDHGRVEDTLERDAEESRRTLERLGAIGVDIDRVTAELVDEGIDKFIQPFDALLQALDEKRAALSQSSG
jgi:transaldolase/glucose-6-phosphate isomerase